MEKINEWIIFPNKGKSQRFGRIINRMSGILNSERLSTLLVIHKVSYSSSSKKN